MAASLDLDLILRQRFGLSSFRGLQRPVIERIVQGQDVLALMPTGAGKSLCYQLPALCRPGLTLVVSPLVALMRDQERRLGQLAIPGRAITAAQSPAERLAIERLVARQALRVLLVSPERALAPGFLDRLAAHVGPAGLGLLVIDEAHCIAEWGSAFRPVYTQLGRLRTRFPTAPVLALTASADHKIQQEILRVLAMSADAVLHASFDRPELFYRVARSRAPWRHALSFLQHYHPGNSAIFYSRRRWEAEALAGFLRSHGVDCSAYHAGLPADSRRAAEQWFLSHPSAVMAATIAFGMGIDKPDVRLVVHLGMSSSLAAYYQESGRAGRDGRAADALLLTHDLPSTADTDAAEDQYPMLHYLRAGRCRRAALLAAFDEQHPGQCGNCDQCRPDWHPLPPLRETRAPWVPPAHAQRRNPVHSGSSRGAGDRTRTGKHCDGGF